MGTMIPLENASLEFTATYFEDKNHNGIDDETEEYVGVENEFVLETVFALFKERNKDFFTFE